MIYKQQKFISHSFRAGKSKLKAPANLMSGECLFPDLQMAVIMF
jgi:hypothetical protein